MSGSKPEFGDSVISPKYIFPSILYKSILAKIKSADNIRAISNIFSKFFVHSTKKPYLCSQMLKSIENNKQINKQF